ncbi:MAG: dihydroxy-acid dehydratase, partial [Desulfofustis sp.]|nr:dihydroxy-acid dehydratase [Desulfofustis sp.]
VREMGSPAFIDNLRQMVEQMPETIIEAILAYNSKGELKDYSHDVFPDLLKKAFLSFAFVIAGQGPKAFGMPEMYVPSQNLKHHQLLESSSLLITDGRYSGVTKGACIGHVTPEAFAGGGIGQLIDGDVMFLQIVEKTLSIIDPAALETGRAAVLKELPERRQLVADRVEKMRERSLQVAASNMMTDVTSAEKGCVPLAVDLRAVACLP